MISKSNFIRVTFETNQSAYSAYYKLMHALMELKVIRGYQS